MQDKTMPFSKPTTRPIHTLRSRGVEERLALSSNLSLENSNKDESFLEKTPVEFFGARPSLGERDGAQPTNVGSALGFCSSKSLCRSASLIAALLTLILAGCGGESYEGQWPDRSKDYQRVVADRCMSMMWGVVIDVEKPAGASSVTITSDGEYGATAGESDVTSKLEVGDVTIELKAESGQKNFAVTVNSKKFGRVSPGNRLRVAPDKTVFVNDTQRKSK